MDLDREIAAIAERARAAARVLAPLDRSEKDAALVAIASGLRFEGASIERANSHDVEAARLARLSDAMIDRLALDGRRIEAMARGVEEIAELEDPVGTVIETRVRHSGIQVSRVRVPIGVIAMVYESRPNVTAEASALTLKAGNAVILRGGSEARATNAAIARVIGRALEETHLPIDAVSVVPFAEHDAVRAIVQCEAVDLAISRGGESLVRFMRTYARVPVVQHSKGVCHLFLDAGCDLEMAKRLTLDGKLARPAASNATECLLVDVIDAQRLLAPVAAALLAGGCEIRGCERTRALLGGERGVKPATDDDFGREFSDRILAVKVVDGIDGAMEHVARYGSGHTEAICTRSQGHAGRWRREIDAACVLVNASTRFHDGRELGLGAEIGIATSRLHWRGPMGLESLTTMKWLVDGTGQAPPGR